MIPNKPRRLGEIQPLERSPDKAAYLGEWVAVKDGRVVAHAKNARDLVPMVRELGEAGEDAVVEFISPPTDTWMVGVG